MVAICGEQRAEVPNSYSYRLQRRRFERFSSGSFGQTGVGEGSRLLRKLYGIPLISQALFNAKKATNRPLAAARIIGTCFREVQVLIEGRFGVGLKYPVKGSWGYRIVRANSASVGAIK